MELYETMLFDNYLHSGSLRCYEILYAEVDFLQLSKKELADLYLF